MTYLLHSPLWWSFAFWWLKMTIVSPKYFVVVLGLWGKPFLNENFDDGKWPSFSTVLCGGPLFVTLTISFWTFWWLKITIVSPKYFVVVLGLLVLILTGTIIGMTQVKHICTSIDILYLGLIFLSLRFASDHWKLISQMCVLAIFLPYNLTSSCFFSLTAIDLT